MFSLSLPGTDEKLHFSSGLDTMIGKILHQSGLPSYEPEALAVCCAIIETQQITEFADVGANIGIFPLVLGKLFPDLAINAFEPLPALNEIARNLCQENGIAANVSNEALSAEVGSATFYISAKSDSSNSLNPTFRPNKGVIEVPLTTLDTLHAASGMKPGLVKIDTESTEPDVLAGAQEYIKSERPWLICEVLAGRTETKLNDFVREMNYIPYSLQDSRFNRAEEILGDPTYVYRDWVFAPEPVSQPLIDCYAKWVRLFDQLEHQQT